MLPQSAPAAWWESDQRAAEFRHERLAMPPHPFSEFRLKKQHEMLTTVTDTDNGAEMAQTHQDNGTRWLEQAGVRPTRQRAILADLLVGDGKHRHVTAESLFEAAKGQGDAVSLATVYNTLRAFCKAGLLQEVTVDGSKSYFDTNTHDHPHFFWEDDGKLTDAPSDQLVISNLPDAPDGAEIASVDVVIRLRRKS
jgi:Fur family iron response transcriptional regulator